MTRSLRPARSPLSSKLLWIVVLTLSAAFLGGLDYGRMKRVVRVTRAAQPEEPVLDPASATGYAQGKRWLIVPEHHNPTYQWIQETQQLFARGEWRVRHVDYENAPQGREVHTASPYHWWIASLAWSHQLLSGKPIGWCVEQTALWSDPLLHLLLLVGVVLFAVRFFGPVPAMIAALGLTTVYPFSASFLPGVLSDSNLAQVIIGWCVLLALAGIRDETRANRWWLLSGLAAGAGLWVSAAIFLPVLGGIALGGIFVAIARAVDKAATRPPIPWRLWGLGAACASLLGYLVEYFPHGMELRPEVNHPLHALTCLGIAELLAWGELWAQRGKFPAKFRELAGAGLGLVATSAGPLFMIWQQRWPPSDLLARQLTNEPDGIIAGSVSSWLTQEGASRLTQAATFLPLLFLIPAVWGLVRREKDGAMIPAAGLGLGLTCVAIGSAFTQLRAWSLAAALLLLLGMILAHGKNLRFLVGSVTALAGASGVLQIIRAYQALPDDAFTHREVEQFYERGLAHWIADHAEADGAVVLAPPFRTPSLNFYGGLRGLGTQNWENREGLATAFRIAAAPQSGEAQAMLNQRGVTYLVLPSWDRDLGDFARLSGSDEKRAFVYQLEHWTVFDWIRPLPYRLPEIGGMAEPVVVLLQVVEPGNRAVAISRVTEYFLEMEHSEVAEHGRQALREFPTDLGALVTIAQVEKARGDENAFREAFNAVVAGITGGSDRFLPWNRRVSLAVILALGGRKDLAQPQLERCWKDMTAARLRSLTTGELYRLLVLGKSYRLQFADPELQTLALRLLPPESRSRF